MVSAIVLVLDEGAVLRLQVPRQVIVLQQDAVLQGLMPTLDLTLGLGIGNCANAYGAKPVPPMPDCFVTDVDAAFMQKVLDVSQ